MGEEIVEDVVEDVVEDDMNAALSAAWDEHEDESDGDSEQGIDASSDSEVTDTADVEAVQPDTDTQDATAEPDAKHDLEPDIDSAPVGLSPAAREAWKDTPDSVRKDIAKREADYSAGIKMYADNAKRAEAMDRTLAPYQQYFAVNGGPQQALSGLLQTGAGLQMGSPAQKAQLVAGLIQQFGVDINTLDNLLVGNQPSAESQQGHAVDQRIQQALQPYQQMMEQQRQQQQHQQQMEQQKVQSEVQQFSTNPANEFYKDVAGEMANILDVYSQNNTQLTMQQAYDKACQMHPEISQIIASRTSANTVQQKRKAATSIHGSPSGTGNALGGDSLHDAINAAWDSVGRA